MTNKEDRTPAPLGLCLGFALTLALDVLTKGLIGVVFPVGIVGIYLLLKRGVGGTLRRIGQLHPWLGAAVFFVVATPWHVLIALANPGHGHPGDLAKIGGHWQVPLPTNGNVHGWTWFYFLNEQVYRYLNVRVPHDYDTSPLWLFYGLIAVWLMPWSIYVVAAVMRALPPWRPLRARLLGPEEKTNLLLLVWAAVPLVFFSLSTRQEYYVLPSLPPLILLVARLLERASIWDNEGEIGDERRPEARAEVSAGNHAGWVAVMRAGVVVLRLSFALAVLGVLISAALLVFLLRTKAPAATTDLASLLQQNPGDYALSFGHFMDLNAQALGLFRLPLALTCFAVLAGPAANFLLRRRHLPHAATLALAAAAFVFLFAAHQGLRLFSPTLTSAQLADAIRPQLKPGDMVAIHGEYEAGSTLGFYLRRNDLHIVEGRSSNLWYGSFFPDAPPIFETRESIAARWHGPQRIFLWEDPHDPDRPVLGLAPSYVVATGGGKRILSNQP